MVGQPGFFALDERHRAVSAAGDVPERLAADGRLSYGSAQDPRRLRQARRGVTCEKISR